ncbi:MAG: hypothetical protein V3R94_04865 [Acidobacteriota bacterium]
MNRKTIAVETVVLFGLVLFSGTLRLADLVVLSGDIMTCPEEQIPQLVVLMTMVDGKVVFQHPTWKPL